MQILLTEAEYNDLVSQKRKRIKADTDELQRLCTLAAIHIPVYRSWSKDDTPRPWGCILDDENDPECCDECPAEKICPNPGKSWSK